MDASWGVCAIERQYRDRQALRRLECGVKKTVMGEDQPNWFVGVDWASRTHHVVLIEGLFPDFASRRRVLLRKRLDKVARVAGDQRTVSDGLNGKSVMEAGCKPEAVSGQVDVDKLPTPPDAHDIFASRAGDGAIPGVAPLLLAVDVLPRRKRRR